MKKLLSIFLVLLIAVTNIFAFEMTNYIGIEADYSVADIKSAKGSFGANITGEFTFCTDEMDKLFYPFGLFGLGLQMNISDSKFEIANEAFCTKIGGGALYRIKNNFYAFDDAELVLMANSSSEEDESKFRVKEAGGRIGVQLSNGSLGIKGGAFVGYSFAEEKGFVFRPFVSGLIGVGGNKVTKYDSVTGEVNREQVIADDISVGYAGLAFTKLPNANEDEEAFLISADCGRDWYFRFDSPEKKAAPLFGFSAGLGYGTLGLTLNANVYGGAGIKITDSVYANLAAGLGGDLGFLKGLDKASDGGKVALLYFGWIIPSGFEFQAFASPSVTFVSKKSGIGVKAGCDVGYTTWLNVFDWTKKTDRENGKGLFVRAYVSIAADEDKIFTKKH